MNFKQKVLLDKFCRLFEKKDLLILPFNIFKFFTCLVVSRHLQLYGPKTTQIRMFFFVLICLNGILMRILAKRIRK